MQMSFFQMSETKSCVVNFNAELVIDRPIRILLVSWDHCVLGPLCSWVLVSWDPWVLGSLCPGIFGSLGPGVIVYLCPCDLMFWDPCVFGCLGS